MKHNPASFSPENLILSDKLWSSCIPTTNRGLFLKVLLFLLDSLLLLAFHHPWGHLDPGQGGSLCPTNYSWQFLILILGLLEWELSTLEAINRKAVVRTQCGQRTAKNIHISIIFTYWKNRIKNLVSNANIQKMSSWLIYQIWNWNINSFNNNLLKIKLKQR